MAQESNWRDKVGSVFVTLVITALGSAAFQSAKYLEIDFHEHRKSSEERFDAKMIAINAPYEYWKKFQESRDKIKKDNDDRDKIFGESLKKLAAGHMDAKKLGDALRTAYRNLGSVSYSPVSGTAMEAERATLVQDLKIQIEGLELLYNWAETPGTLKDKLKLAKAIERNSFQRSQSLNAVVAALEASQIEFDHDKKANDEAGKQYKEELQEDLRSLRMARDVLMGSLVGYVLLVAYVTSRPKPKTTDEEKTAVAAAK